MSNVGRIEMIEELRETTRLFEEVDAAVTAIRGPLSRRLGISEDTAKKELEKMLARAAARDDSRLTARRSSGTIAEWTSRSSATLRTSRHSPLGRRFARLAGCENGTDVGDGGSARGLPM